MNEAKEIEQYLFKQAEGPERLLTEAKLLLNNRMREDLQWQLKTYELIDDYGRRIIRSKIAEAERKVFSEDRFSRFRNSIYSIFKK